MSEQHRKFADQDLKDLEKLCMRYGLSSKQYNDLTVIISRMMKHMAQEISLETLTWDLEQLKKQQEETKKEREAKTGIWGIE